MEPVSAVLGLVGGAFALVAAGGLVDLDAFRPPARARRRGLDLAEVFAAACSFGPGAVPEGPKAWRQMVLEDPTVQDELAALRSRGLEPRLERGRLSVVRSGDASPAPEREGLALAETLEQAAWGPWTRFGSRFGMHPDHEAPHGLRGSHGPLELRAVATSAMPLALRARLRVHLPIPPGQRFRLEKRVEGTEGVELVRGFLVTERDGEELEEGMALLVALAEGFLAELDDPWERLRRRPDVHGAGDELWGEVEGVRLELRRGDGLVEIRAPLGVPLPEGTLLIHADHGRIDRTLHDPILDPLLTIQSSDLGALAARIANDALRGVLLDVVHGAPGSFVDARQVVCRVQPPLRSLDPWVDRVVRLVQALDAED